MAATQSFDAPKLYFSSRTRWQPVEIVFWLATLLPFALFPDYLILANEIAITALFAISLDLILGYAGIVSLGHAAFFGFGAYAAALFAKNAMPDPWVGLAVGIGATGLLGLVTSALILRGTDLTRLMVTLGVAAILYE